MIFIQHCCGGQKKIKAQMRGPIHKYKLGKFSLEQNQPEQTKQKPEFMQAASKRPQSCNGKVALLTWM